MYRLAHFAMTACVCDSSERDPLRAQCNRRAAHKLHVQPQLSSFIPSRILRALVRCSQRMREGDTQTCKRVPAKDAHATHARHCRSLPVARQRSLTDTRCRIFLMESLGDIIRMVPADAPTFILVLPPSK